MRALGLKKSKPGLHLLTVDEPQIVRDDEVKVRMIRVGICGTDRSLIKHHLVDVPDGVDHLVLGHEGYGEVVEIGSAVTTLRPGQKVVLTVRRPCGLCEPCRLGQSDMCATGLYTERGIHKDQGFLTEYVVDREQFLVPVPAGLESLASWAEPYSIVEKGMDLILLQLQRLPWGCAHEERHKEEMWAHCKKALIFGFGPIGFAATSLAVLQGMKTFVLERKDEDSLKVRMMQEFGASYIDSRRVSKDQLFGSVGPFDVIIEATGASKDALELIPAMNRDAIYLLTGVPRVSKEKVELDADLIIRHIVRYNQMIIGTVNGNRKHFEAALRDLAKLQKKFPDVMQSSVTHHFKLEEYERALTMLGNPDSMKIVFDLGSDGG